MNAITKANPALDPAIIESLVIGGDLSGLSNDKRVAYYNYRCKQVGLDPSAKPFDLLKLNGKLILYANAGCTQQLCQIHGLSPIVKDKQVIDGIFVVTSHVSDKEGRQTENIGAVPIGGLKGDQLANAMMKGITKAHRRTVLMHCGLGMLDETEVETIPDARPVRGNPMRFEYANIADEIEACGDREQLDAFWESVGKEFHARAGAHAAKTSGIDYGETAYERYLQKRDKLPDRKEDKRARVKSIEEYPNAAQSSADVAPAATSQGSSPESSQDGGNEPAKAPAAPPQGADAVQAPPEPSPTEEILPEYSKEMNELFSMIDLAETQDDLTEASLAIAKHNLSEADKNALRNAYRVRAATLRKMRDAA